MAAPQNYNQLKKRILKKSTCKTATPPHSPVEIESWIFDIKFLTTSPNKQLKDFLNFFPYVEKIVVEGGPR